LEDRVRFGVNRVVLDQNNAGQLACAGQVLFDYRLTVRRLLRGEAKNIRWIAPYYESHPGVAHIADPSNRMSGSRTRDEHRIRPRRNGARLKATLSPALDA
jgi:hypothetical protein